ncbi:o-succinylbenzoate--CoA ligase [Williamsia sp. Leaf354]|uniref:o-succinylbenzoate--CoA ligase n=1 Tax=Williamsia sp. Leaf354 TaxID=1736349 RepID=UPI0009E7D59C|nr:o-succinylbenzoate--CoA ligase [Williamsia sp. Leaf354]
MRTLTALPLASGPSVLDVVDDLHAIIDGSIAALPVPAGDPREIERLESALGAGEQIDDDIALVIATSGTTGVPKGALHTAATLAASAAATDARLGGPGGWLLALPAHHIAGLQVLLRCLRAGFTPVVIDVARGFDPADMIRGIDTIDGPRRYTSLVPTQLIKVLDDPNATAALREVDAVLIGGAATPQLLQQRAIDAQLPIVRTYGMSETCGGCVYDGVPLEDVEIVLDSANVDGVGRVLLRGPMVARGYRNVPDHSAFAVPGEYRTDDLGRLDDGVLSIIGRADEAITTGGLTVVPQVVEAAILSDPAVAECAVFGLPDERLGEKVVAAVVPSIGATIDPERVRAAVTERLDRSAAPRDVHIVDALPLRGPGKIDRAALRLSLS